ncbi:LysR family transcriptional regulator [Pseudooceanicola sp. CBS1P-1]|uniref:LysR family transcriptional regulator n=1 Tax=Pseudooceanicola albus TaxID=2692189 RepID=A0A6L7G7U5_9RHOB|nr:MULTISPECIES: LysR family transcriptional regulator [Pseudooceanicola]MBT9386254.1 LysR family transcriptional regulator [Pseudooceanicola endophyticus]MXN20304.1 LysR family transcriptional regulator [Pseudooceanicola albus]
MATDTQALIQRLMTRGKFRHMQALVRLCDLRSMARAAESMGMTQPGMSQLVAELEKLVGMPLFLRHNRGIEPTELARDLELVARRILTAVQESAETVILRRDHQSTLVRLAATTAGAGAILQEVLPDFARQHRTIQLQLSEVYGLNQEAAIASGEVDLLCCRASEVLPEGWEFLPCKTDSLVVVAASTHPLAGQDHVPPEALREALWLPNHIATVARRRYEEIAESYGFASAPQARVVSRQMLLSWMLLREGTMVTMMPYSVALPWIVTGQLVVLNTGIEVPLDPLGLVWNPKEAQSGTRSFVEYTLSHTDHRSFQ